MNQTIIPHDFEEISNNQNYIQEKVVFNIIKANVTAIIFLATLACIFGGLYFLIWGEFSRSLDVPLLTTNGSLFLTLANFGIMIMIIFAALLIHECLHALPATIFCKKGVKSVKIGIMPYTKLFTPYCTTKEILSVNHYRIIAILPMFILGLIPIIIALKFALNAMLVWGIIMTVGGWGDTLFLWKLRKEKQDALIYDLPNEAGFIIFRKKDNLRQ
jgi:hypothetical protein